MVYLWNSVWNILWTEHHQSTLIWDEIFCFWNSFDIAMFLYTKLCLIWVKWNFDKVMTTFFNIGMSMYIVENYSFRNRNIFEHVIWLRFHEIYMYINIHRTLTLLTTRIENKLKIIVHWICFVIAALIKYGLHCFLTGKWMHFKMMYWMSKKMINYEWT